MHNMPQHNRVTEQLNWTLVKRVRAVLHASGLPKNLWGEAIKHTVYVKNHTAMHALDGKTPYEMLHGKKPNLMDLPVWGTKVWVRDPSGSKLDPHAREGRWIGVDAETGAHRVYFADRRTIAIERNVSFERNEGVGLTLSSPIERESETTKNNQQTPLGTPNVSLPTKPQVDPLRPNFEQSSDGLRRSTRQQTESRYLQMLRSGTGTHSGRSSDTLFPRGMKGVEKEGEKGGGESMGASGEGLDGELGFDEELTSYAMFAGMSEVEGLEPQTIKDVRTRPDWPKWQEAINAELMSLDEAHTWDVVLWPKNTNIVSSKWVFNIKRNAAGEIDKYKARLIA